MAPKALQSVIKWLYGHSEPRVLLLGEAASGKTTFLSQLILGQVVYTIPTMGYYLTPFDYKWRTYMLWDTGSTSILLFLDNLSCSKRIQWDAFGTQIG